MKELIAQSSFFEITILLALAATLGLVGILLRQPLVVSFVALGIATGPTALDLVHSQEKINLLSELGIALLLFLVGIKLDLKLIKSIGAVSLATGLGQVFFTSLIGFLLGLALGFDVIASLYIGVALTFSSTIIIVKLLSDKHEIDTLHGKIALGFLIVQDLVVVLAMIVLASFAVGNADVTAKGSLAPEQALLSIVGLLAFIGLFIRFVANPLSRMLAHVPELLLIFSVAMATMMASVGKYIGLGMEVGGLLAGVALASTPYREAISTRLAPLRDFLLLFFFIGLGAQLHLSDLGAHLAASLLFSAFVLIGNPLIVLAIMGAMGYRKRTGFLAGLTVAQISEFSLIFIAMGVTIGHVQQDVMGLVTLVGIITIALSTYMITYSHTLYGFFEKYLTVFERTSVSENQTIDHTTATIKPEIMIFGLGRLGRSLLATWQQKGTPVLGIDVNPAEVQQLVGQSLPAIYGDVTDGELVSELPFEKTEWVICTFPWHHTGLTFDDGRHALLQTLRRLSYTGKTIAIAHSERDVKRLNEAGFDIVISPHAISASVICDLVKDQ
ncbi:cation:proton antiporter [Salinimonas chungwhensis]|uniref:cation:proton antiporter n=1 Tax=Salinimonas chungwhensis TaxID=265425 RepID=UPI000363A36A|nr:cation:proton antiporter family protein [Salinimonas chungwhensis]